MKVLLIALLSLGLLACDKQAPLINLTGNTSVAAPGEEVQLTVTASDNKILKVIVVDAVLYYDSASKVANIKRMYINEDKSGPVSDHILYTIPTTLFGDTLGLGDYFEFTAYAEDAHKSMISKWKVDIEP